MVMEGGLVCLNNIVYDGEITGNKVKISCPVRQSLEMCRLIGEEVPCAANGVNGSVIVHGITSQCVRGDTVTFELPVTWGPGR